jgi:hypothetical protein
MNDPAWLLAAHRLMGLIEILFAIAAIALSATVVRKRSGLAGAMLGVGASIFLFGILVVPLLYGLLVVGHMTFSAPAWTRDWSVAPALALAMAGLSVFAFEARKRDG